MDIKARDSLVVAIQDIADLVQSSDSITSVELSRKSHVRQKPEPVGFCRGSDTSNAEYRGPQSIKLEIHFAPKVPADSKGEV